MGSHFERAVEKVKLKSSKNNFFRSLLRDAHVVPDSSVPNFMQYMTNAALLRPHRNLDADDDSYAYDSFDFGGYSLKYSTCQQVEQWSDYVASSENYPSTLVKKHLVIFTICLSNSCSTSTKYGCANSYGQYVVDLDIYLQAFNYYKQEKASNYCNNCARCLGVNDDEADAQDQENEEQEDEGDAENERKLDQDANENEGDDGGEDDYEKEEESDYVCDDDDNVCDDYETLCKSSDGDLDYFQYLGCSKIQAADNYGNYYYLNARCARDRTVKMGVYYDSKCYEYAGDDVDINSVTGIDFSTNYFSEVYQGPCLSCESSDGDLYGNATYEMCSKLYEYSGKCNQFLSDGVAGMYNEENYFQDDVCEYINDIQNGVYDNNGRILANNFIGEVSSIQACVFWLLFFSCIGLGIHANTLRVHSSYHLSVKKSKGMQNMKRTPLV